MLDMASDIENRRGVLYLPARASMSSVAETHIVRSGGHELPARLLTRPLAKVVEPVPVKLVAIRAPARRVQQVHAGHHEVRPFGDLGAIMKCDGRLGLSAHGKGRCGRVSGTLLHDAVEEA